MSSSVVVLQPGPDDIIPLISYGVFLNYAGLAGLAWYTYDYLLTLPLEISAVWKTKWSGTTMLFLVNRYLFMFTWTFFCLESLIITQSSRTCAIIFTLSDACALLNSAAISLIFILRTYAICGQNRIILGVFVSIFLARLGLYTWFAILDHQHVAIVAIPRVDQIGTCASLFSGKPTLVEDILAVVFDASIFFVTLCRTAMLYRQAKAMGMKAKLTALLLRDGSLYFCLLTSWNILYITVILLGVNVPSILAACINLSLPLEAILANRLVLNLRSIGTSEEASELSCSEVDTYFRRAYGPFTAANRPQCVLDAVLGNVGEPMRVEDDWDTEEDDASEGQEAKDGIMENVV